MWLEDAPYFFVRVFLGESHAEHMPHEGSGTMVFSVALLAGLSIASGLLIYFPATLVETIVKQMAVIIG